MMNDEKSLAEFAPVLKAKRSAKNKLYFLTFSLCETEEGL